MASLAVSWWLAFTLIEWGIRLVMVAVILRKRFAPATALAWLCLVFFLPELGLVLYLLLGDSRLGRRRVRRHRQTIAAVRSEERLATQMAHVTQPDIEPAHQGLILQAQMIGGFNILGGNHVELLEETETVIQRLIQDIDAAQHHVHLLYYIFANDQTARAVCDALIRARGRGVNCRVLADAAGSWHFFSRRGLYHYLRQHDIEVYPMLPVAPLRRRLERMDLRNHRKLAVIDGRIAYAGSHNIVNPDYGRRGLRWIDLTGRFTGPIVAQLQLVFLEDWAFETGQELSGPDILPPLDPAGMVSAQTVPTGPSHESETLPRVLLAAINAAQRRVIITTPYLVPDEPTLLALAMAADRGVEVDLVLPEKADHPLVAAAGRAYFEELLESGVSVHLYQEGLLHAKTITVDDSFALLGSSNLDIRSFYLNFELNVLMYGRQITHDLRYAQLRYLGRSRRVEAETWRNRPLLQRYAESAVALLSPLL